MRLLPISKLSKMTKLIKFLSVLAIWGLATSAHAGQLYFSSGMTTAMYFDSGFNFPNCTHVKKENLLGTVDVKAMAQTCANPSGATNSDLPHFVSWATADGSGITNANLRSLRFVAASAANPHVCFTAAVYAVPAGAFPEVLSGFDTEQVTYQSENVASTLRVYQATANSNITSIKFFPASGGTSTCSGSNCSNALLVVYLRRIRCSDTCSKSGSLVASCCPTSCNNNTSSIDAVGTWFTEN